MSFLQCETKLVRFLDRCNSTHRSIGTLVMVLIFVLFTGCVAQPVNVRPNSANQSVVPRVKQVDIAEPISIPTSTNILKVQLKAVLANLSRGDNIGRIYGGPRCRSLTDLKWKRGRANFTTEDMITTFIDVLAAAGHRTVGISNSIFKSDDTAADLFIGGSLTQLHANICMPAIHLGDSDSTKGSMYIKVEWEIYSTLERRVIATFTTAGSSDSGNRTVSESQVLLEQAFAAATENLLATEGYIDLVSTPLVKEAVVFDPIGIPPIRTYRRNIQENLKRIRSSVVTVFTPSGHGSGFFVSEDGYILTNQHVVGNAEIVRVALPSGKEINGRVIRQHVDRDVALVKIDYKVANPLPIETKGEEVGIDVYAIGSPLDKIFSSTVSKGILSAYRGNKGNHVIQSDAMIHGGSSGGPLLNSKGNVIAITVAKMKTYEGVNFFIPISSALDALSIKLTNKQLPVLQRARQVTPPQPILGQLIVNAKPENAKVLFQESRLAYFPGIQLKQGRYKIKVHLTDYKTVYKTITVREGKNEIDISLKRETISCNECFGIADCPFVDNGDGTITDTRTSLMWMKCSLGQQWSGNECQGTAKEYQNPNSVYQGKNPISTTGGYSDWSLPSLNELNDIVQKECKGPAINQQVFPSTPSGNFLTYDASSCHFMPVMNFESGKESTLYCFYPAYVRMRRSSY